MNDDTIGRAVMERTDRGSYFLDIADPSSGIRAWEAIWENDIFPSLDVADNFFDAVDPAIDFAGLGDSWSGIQDWADQSFPEADLQQDQVAQAVQEETDAAGGVQFCCYGTVRTAFTRLSRKPISIFVLLTVGIQIQIHNASIRLVGVMSELHAKIEPHEPYNAFSVSKDGSYLMLKFPDGCLFAQLNEALAGGLGSLDDLSSIEIKAFAETKSIYHVLARAKKPGEAKLKADVNIYGTVGDADRVVEKLSLAKLFLQDPEYGIANVEYINPHLIQFPGFDAAPAATAHHDVVGPGRSGRPGDVEDEQDNFKQALSSIYQSLKRQRNLQGVRGSSHLLTALLDHQETALSFMMQRESGPIPAEFSLWKRERNTVTTIYRHRLTGAESLDPPNELGGGILADEMGMGKSLSALALITSTRNEGIEWSKEPPENARMSRSSATLILVPSTLILNSWLAEIEKRIDKSLTVAKYYGRDRDADLEAYHSSDFVFTTYHTIAYSLNQRNKTIFNIEWFRVVLDEAHLIRRRETTLYQAASQISAKFRWCLTGTPIQNHLEDIGSLLGFLRIDQLENRAAFRNHIVAPFAEDVEAASRRFACLLDSVCLKRSHDLLDLPQMTEQYRYITLPEDERQMYDKTLADMAHLIREKARHNPGRRDQFGIFQAQLQLRLLCNHGTFQRPFLERQGLNRDRRAEREDFLHALGPTAEMTCSVCGIPITVFDVVGGESAGFRHACGHKLCEECLAEAQRPRGDGEDGGASTMVCPLCSTEVTSNRSPKDHGASAPISTGSRDGYFNKSGFSSKLNALLEDLEKNPPGTKSIVFSCWTRTLDLVSVHLTQRRILHQRIDGDQNLAERQRNMDHFISDASFPILLMSTGVGAFGLNLTAANRVYILEPQWNPSVEQQAIGRVSRLGQKKDVLVTRYLVSGTVEIRMQAQQIRKDELAKVGFQAARFGDDSG
ncbi:helicase conserved domain-containing protein [Podospora aff. communis PSN243]|uniref:Helicase conserved domain-containing protein n=1 Tax=Podospora aff. communis PSN243 TaxID=3040156 RepID=A0AAV9G210_9PEZI|nr:helicase conserved domain-containing protein [Podospora aff. communis PSN243]